MLKTDWQKRICDEYRKNQCKHCPLIFDHDLLICKRNSHYNPKKHKWIPDEVIK